MIRERLTLIFIHVFILFVLTLFPVPVSAAPPNQEDDLKSKADALYDEGNAFLEKANYPEAIERFEAALEIYQVVGLQAEQAESLNQIGSIYRRMGQYMQALEFLQQALTIWQATDNRAGEGITLNNMGLAYVGLGQYPQALESYESALVAKQEIGDEISIGKTLNNIGEVYLNVAQYSQGLGYFQQAWDIQEKAHDPVLDAAILNNFGTAFRGLGRYAESLEAFSLALTVVQQTGDQAEQGRIFDNIGEVYHSLGQYPQALEYYERALAIAKQIGDQGAEATRLANIGTFYLDQGEPILALGYLRAALGISREIGHRLREGTILVNIGSVYRDVGEYSKALDHFQQALAIAQEIGDRRGEAVIQNNIGEVYIALEQYPQALERLQQTLEVTQEIEDRTQEVSTLSNLGFLHEQKGDKTKAIQSYQDSIKILESIQSDIKIDELKASFVANQIGTYERVIGLLWDEGRFEEAFTYTERARARAFLDQLASGAVDLRAGTNAALLEQELTLKSELASLRAQLLDLRNRPQSEWDAQSIAAVQEVLTNRESDYAQLLTEIKVQSPETASLLSVDVASLAAIQAQLDSNTTLIEYFVTGDRTLVFIITKSTLHTTAIDVQQDELFSSIFAFREFASLVDAHPTTLKKLHTWLIAPLEDKLTTPVLGIIPHGVLHYIPFAALTDGAQYLNESYSIFTLPSASVLPYIQDKRKPKIRGVLALGNPVTSLPDLEFAEREVEFIADLYGTRAWTGSEATESKLREQARGAGILHLAAHGEYNANNPLFSTIHLVSDSENDGRLEVHEIFGLDLTQATDLVVLSACQTNIGAMSAGDEVVGMTRAFFYAGTPTVIASLWNVDDQATTLFMERFYTHLREGLGKALALRQAQREVREQYPHPYYWAAFVVTGDPGAVAEPDVMQSLFANQPVVWGGAIMGALLLFTVGLIIRSKRRKRAA